MIQGARFLYTLSFLDALAAVNMSKMSTARKRLCAHCGSAKKA